MQRQRQICAVLAIIVSILATLTCAGSSPTPPCKAAASKIEPKYGALNAAPTVGVWRSTTLEFGRACPTVLNGPAKLVIALSSRFDHAGTVEDLAARIGAVSALKGLKYWSVTDRGWRVLISQSNALNDLAKRRQRTDFTAREVLSGKALFMVQRDTRSTGRNIYAIQATSAKGRQLAVSIVNLTDIRFLFETLFERQALVSVHFFTQLRGNEWGYYSLTVVKKGSVEGRSASFINRAAAFERFITGKKPDMEPPVAR